MSTATTSEVTQYVCVWILYIVLEVACKLAAMYTCVVRINLSNIQIVFTQNYLCTRFAYIEDAVICVLICKVWTVGCLCFSIAAMKVLFIHCKDANLFWVKCVIC